MNFEFSILGLFLLLLLFVPNIIWTKFIPKDYENYSKRENKILLILERIGEVATVVFALFCGAKFSWSLLLIIIFILMALYEVYWIRYFMSSHTMKDMCDSLLMIPLPGATLPVIAFFLFGIYSNSIFLVISSIILAIGHIGIHYNHKKQCNLN
ncbi:hypothetical protein mru_0167 [Methanobrevibacter ruminantium M1]|uniref:Uncharacterized protein n=1 Tax=Methanobrevibacter ruminantium (strain ATCC 35063 / DSM 1093 / JCM 13430 / OCM 146 / M1) TaxID=634498 RepID=D3DYU9_METRM|nr:hypothetical protein [Methanobrevibacter ruminantium]ADC46019.1 hypothetical protein mru_0167 [Methanobrevibacter ruminantium M1]